MSVYRRNYKVTLKDGSTEVRQQPWYTIELHVPGQKYPMRVKGPRDKKAAKAMEADLRRKVERGEVDLIDPYADHKRTGLAEHLTDWLNDLRSSGRSDKYISNCERRLKILFNECGWKTIPDIDAGGFMRWRDRRRSAKRKGTRKELAGTSAATLNQFLDTARAFLNWCVRTAKRTALDPLVEVEKAKGPKVRKRRALTDEEVQKLLAVAQEDRKLVYRVGLSIGLRRSELGKLKWGDIRLTAIPGYIQLRAEATKARRGDRVFLPATLADDLRKLRPDDASDDEAVFPRVPLLAHWKKDLEAAGIPYRDAMGRQVDFHAGTRKTLCTRMHRAGKPLAVAMRIMRHVDARLTMVDYTDDEQIGVSDVLPELQPIPAPAAQASA